MKKILSAAATLAAAAIPMFLASCGQQADSASGKGKAEAISEFSVDQTVKSAEKYYVLTFGGDTAYLQKATIIHWPDKIGDADIAALRDTLLSYCYGAKAMPVNDAISAYLDDTSELCLASEEDSIAPADSVPASDHVRSWYDNVSATVLEINSETATYEVTSSSYLGGAHPMTVTTPFTYDLAAGRVMTLENMFEPGSTDSLMTVIKTALARQLNVRPDQLARAGISTDQLTAPGQPYIMGGSVIFHYNPYDIAPYAMGSVDVTVYPYELQDLLSPGAKAIINHGF
ncbi:MAG: DUF3298 and DUF4163 domain-containing protein [Duncaniella sp.]|nr:DUF3298 and DUF4163 domain-containing protein [Duncaniella sp.]MDE5734948.1 DUF3298 and DUF4163 domain-containing protein [Duncaniella sp.]MDE6178801.1 DUF3298 and DUF4163 domain-containing protein [Duncaniella sp.]